MLKSVVVLAFFKHAEDHPLLSELERRWEEVIGAGELPLLTVNVYDVNDMLEAQGDGFDSPSTEAHAPRRLPVTLA